MRPTFFFYDLETSGFNARSDRIMQFGGQRTDMNLKPVEEPVDILIKMTGEIVPSPDAIMVTGITPQKTIAEGITEAEFVKQFDQEIAKPNTIFVGFNTIRFDDEFMRFLLYRNFYDAYEWQWKDGRGRWDLLDVVRMTRALRPEGVKWPVNSDGKPTNRLELLTSINNLSHDNAHDALSDVHASIALARLIKTKQPKLFDYLLSMRDKKKIAELVDAGQPFVYSSGKYESEFEKTTVVQKIADHPESGALVYDLRKDPTQFIQLSPEQLVDRWRYKKESEEPRLPVKTLKYNRCPAVSPMGVLDVASQKRLGIDLEVIKANRQKLADNPSFIRNVVKALTLMDTLRQETLLQNEQDVDAKLYDGFISDKDKKVMNIVQRSDAANLTDSIRFDDARLTVLLPLYKARNFPNKLSDSERAKWEEFKTNKLSSKLPKYFERLEELAKQPSLTSEQRYVLEELQLYGQSIMPL